LCIFGSSSLDFVHFWKLLVGLCIFESSFFRKCTKSHEELPKMHKIPWETSKYAQNQARIFQKWVYILEVSHGILSIIPS
jgi:hypothetical protein